MVLRSDEVHQFLRVLFATGSSLAVGLVEVVLLVDWELLLVELADGVVAGVA